MKTISLLLLFALASVAPGPALGQTAEELASEVRTAEQTFAATMAERDLDAFVSHLADEAVFFTGKVLRGAEEIATAWSPFFEGAAAPFSWEPEQVEVLDSGTLALSSGPVYDPAEAAWRPVVAPGYLVIHCLWVSGWYKGRRLGCELLQRCLADSRSYRGVVAVSGRSPYLTDTPFYLHQGFELLEHTDTGYDLVCYRADDNGADAPPRRQRAEGNRSPGRRRPLRVCAPVPVRPRMPAGDVRGSAGPGAFGHDARAGHGRGGSGRGVALRHVRRLPPRQARYARVDEWQRVQEVA